MYLGPQLWAYVNTNKKEIEFEHNGGYYCIPIKQFRLLLESMDKIKEPRVIIKSDKMSYYQRRKIAKRIMSTPYNLLSDCITDIFIWKEQSEGHSYWQNLSWICKVRVIRDNSYDCIVGGWSVRFAPNFVNIGCQKITKEKLLEFDQEITRKLEEV